MPDRAERDQVDDWFQEYVFGFMTNDISGGISAGTNFLVALGLSTYTEILGRFVVPDDESEDHEKCFAALWNRLGEAYRKFGAGRAYGLIRSGMVHYYFVQAGRAGTGVAGVATRGAVPLVVTRDGHLRWVVVEQWFDDWKKAARSVETELMSEDHGIRRARNVIRTLMRLLPD